MHLGMMVAYLGKTFMIVDGTISNELNLGNSRDSLEIRMQDGFLSFSCLVVAMSVALGARIKSLNKYWRYLLIMRQKGNTSYLSQSILLFWAEIGISEQ